MNFGENTTEGKLLAIYDTLVTEGSMAEYQKLTGIIAKEAAAWKMVKLAGGVGKIIGAATTDPDTIARDLADLSVENSIEEASVYERTVQQLREAGLSEEILAKIDDNLRYVTGGNPPGLEPPTAGREK